MKTREEIQESVIGKLAASGLRALKRGAGEQMIQLPFTLGVNVAGLMGDQVRQGLNLYGARAKMGGAFSAAGTRDRRRQGKQNVDRAIVDPLIGTQEKPGAVQLGIARGLDKYNELQLANVSDKIKKIKAMEAEPSKRSAKENEELTAERKRLEKKQDKFGRRLGIGESADRPSLAQMGYTYGGDKEFPNPRKTVGQKLLARYGKARRLNPEFSDVPLTDKDREDIAKRQRSEAEIQAQRQGNVESETMGAATSSDDVADALSAKRKKDKDTGKIVGARIRSNLMRDPMGLGM